ncbi:LapA family protein [Roseomonas sp. BN140053]|uniref:LapA family protein n=1 Tax=Roseomonas sp. BN140053 TaxID=3391898 RepID=UPI0039EA8A31
MWRWVLIAPLLVVLVIFALSNTQPVDVGFWPFDLTWQTPLSVAVLSVSALAFLVGAVVAWASGMPQRRRARDLSNASRLLQAEVEQLRAEAAKPVPGSAATAAPATTRRPATALPAP